MNLPNFKNEPFTNFNDSDENSEYKTSLAKISPDENISKKLQVAIGGSKFAINPLIST